MEIAQGRLDTGGLRPNHQVLTGLKCNMAPIDLGVILEVSNNVSVLWCSSLLFCPDIEHYPKLSHREHAVSSSKSKRDKILMVLKRGDELVNDFLVNQPIDGEDPSIKKDVQESFHLYLHVHSYDNAPINSATMKNILQ